MDYDVVSVDDPCYTQAVEPVVTFYDDYVQPDLTDLTPGSIASAFQDSQQNFQPSYHSNLFLIDSSDFRTFRLMRGAEERNFHNNHPCARLVSGTHVNVVCQSRLYSGVVDSIDIDQGSITFTGPMGIPYMVVDVFGGNSEKQDMFQSLIKLDQSWEHMPQDVKDFFLLNRSNGGVIKDTTKFAYIQGAVGSGKTYSLAQDIRRHRKTDMFQVVVSETNMGLVAAGEELEKQGLRVVHFTRKESPYAMAKIMASCDGFKKWDHWTKKDPDTDDARGAKLDAKNMFTTELRGYVILTTPSRVSKLSAIIGLDKEPTNIYIDEAGVMSFGRFAAILLLKINRLWIYGDHEQHAPFNEDEVYVPPQDVQYLKVAERARNFATRSVAWLFEEMNYPKRFIDKSRRLSVEDAESLLPFFYEDGKDFPKASTWLLTKMPSLGRKTDQDVWVPPSLLSYPYLTMIQKNKEASRMRKFFNWFFDHCKANEANLRKGRISGDQRPDYAMITTHRHLAASMKEMIDRWYSLQEWNISIYCSGGLVYRTTRVAQGSTFQRSVFYTPYTLSSFVNDPHFLVAMSRHTTDLVVAPYSVAGLLRFGIISYLLSIGAITAKFQPFKPKKPDRFNFSMGPTQVFYRVNLFCENFEVVRDFFATQKFEQYRKLVDLPYLDHEERLRWYANAGLSGEVVKRFVDTPFEMLPFGGKGRYKFILLTMFQEPLYLTGEKGCKFLGFDGRLSATGKYGVRVEISGEVTMEKKNFRTIGLRPAAGIEPKVLGKGNRYGQRYIKDKPIVQAISFKMAFN